MKVMIDLCIVPLGAGLSVSPFVTECHKVIREHGLEPVLHAYGTGIEGEWEHVMETVKKCFEKVHEMGAPRVHATMRLGTRNDREQSMQDKVDSVNRKLGM